VNDVSKEMLSKVPKIIVGNKIDMRETSNMNHIQTEAVKVFKLYIVLRVNKYVLIKIFLIMNAAHLLRKI